MNFSYLGLPQISTRLIGLVSKTIDARTVEIALCHGGPVERAYGMERLRILASSINLDRMRNDCAIPLLDGLMEDSVIERSLGKLIDVRIQAATVWGTVRFHQTDKGREAAELVAANKVSAVTAYEVLQMEVYDAKNRRVDPNNADRANEPGLVFEIVKWQPAALGLVRRDPAADDHADRAYSPIDPAIAELFSRMAERHMIATASDVDKRLVGQRMRPEINRSIFGNTDRGADDESRIIAATKVRMRSAQKLAESGGFVDWKAIRLPPDLIYYGTAEKFKP
jgi:hypothetical protein